ncbi:hypothetical protein DFJ73DRAFT_857483 [Zopfochytrium polystomum]|nr:hypothetical protein DFJ73DRAFT_857483 [Zopfochytrium polystomum]
MPAPTPLFDFFHRTRNDPDHVLNIVNALIRLHSSADSSVNDCLGESNPHGPYSLHSIASVVSSLHLPPGAAGAGADSPGDVVRAVAAMLDEASMVGDPAADALVQELKDPSAYTRLYVPPARPAQYAGDVRPSTPAEIATEAKGHFAGLGKANEELTATFLANKLGLGFAMPEWVVPEELERAGVFHWQNIGMIYVVLLHGSLGGGFGVPRVDQVLNATGRLGSTDPKRSLLRLIETTDMIANSFHSDVRQLTEVGGLGWRSNVKVRLIHAGVRARLATKLRDESTIPINQADMAVTLLSFSVVVLAAMLKFGYRPTRQELHDYMAAWRFIGHLNGINDKYNPCKYGVDYALLYLSLLLYPSVEGGVLLRGPTPTNTAPLMLSAMLTRRVFTGVASFAAGAARAKASSPPSQEEDVATFGKPSPFGLGYHASLVVRIVGPIIASRLGIVKAGRDRWKLSSVPHPDITSKEISSFELETLTYSTKHEWFAFFTILMLRITAWLRRLPIIGRLLRKRGMRVATAVMARIHERLTAKKTVERVQVSFKRNATAK